MNNFPNEICFIIFGGGEHCVQQEVTSRLMLLSLYKAFDERDKNGHEKRTSEVPLC